MISMICSRTGGTLAADEPAASSRMHTNVRYRSSHTHRVRQVRWLTAFLCTTVLVGSVGCGTVWYKQGSTDADFETARDRCRADGRGAGADFERCMQERGWIATRVESRPAPNGANENVPIATPVPTPSSHSSGDIAPAPRRDEAAPVEQRPVVVKNWFKLGGTAAELDAAMTRCARQLGETEPSPDSPLSHEMIECLHNAGWRAF